MLEGNDDGKPLGIAKPLGIGIDDGIELGNPDGSPHAAVPGATPPSAVVFVA